MSMKARIESKLSETFSPDQLDVIDESEDHRGHGGWREGGETHFRVRMTAATLSGQSRVARQRAVNKCLAEELASTVHALAMELKAPGE
ncbi:MAG: BolA family protein [Pseudomonadota bacterium]